ncbi:hypothetical protein H6B15_13850 [Gemmiger formicilis]|uniref:hypothetical protein n=1 Tax=Gemmiger formicilis TaxID=745368 RepID=UPI0019586F93|nr:hypothetical protein [Gemmiger formicilis]MBM6717738.1 hypothetical protein [Gemmiger formicilis]
MQNARFCVIIASGKRSNRSNQNTFAAPEKVQQALIFIRFAQKARKTVVFRAFFFSKGVTCQSDGLPSVGSLPAGRENRRPSLELLKKQGCKNDAALSKSVGGSLTQI